MKKYFLYLLAFVAATLSSAHPVSAQQYKLKQSTSLMGMKSESTIYVKGMRKRTEAAPLMGFGATIVTIEQCDLQRNIKLNDKKKVYFIEPFSKDDEIIEEEEKPTRTETNPVRLNNSTKKGGTIYMYYSINDTGERKKMYDFTARHVWTNQKMKPSPDACNMKDSMIIKTDGWYIDLPQFNCPVTYRPKQTAMQPQKQVLPDCQDKFVTRRSGKGKLGFPLQETTTIIMGSGKGRESEFTTSVETLEFSTAQLDSSLFTIPPGYKEVKSEEELQEKFDAMDMMNQYKNQYVPPTDAQKPTTPEQKASGIIRVGVFEPAGDGQLPMNDMQKYLVAHLTGGKIEALAVTSEEDARKFNCDYTLGTEFLKIKSGSKVGGLLKAIKNSDPNAASSFTIENALLLKKLKDGSVVLQQKIEGKYDGKMEDAAKKSLDEEADLVLRSLN